ncbi:DUF4226 domain-containing protein [Mycobacterium szulgai]|uniref:DUF4226 domain-containing protein n=1 Tax=Mycobacterium szulgai TaxID=1787 RepID=A0A1X2DYA2_MYCSZ|nr:DUF4226 domain-containing protein [Mycobacterium szulgai]MCV7075861.1 DUF4226 domain-containing protein [Mycobacterium szulgai]ORW93163.1 hypothetical protein AWC27_00480 [Mycobacterium szulgai]
MSDQTGSSLAAIAERQAILARQHGALAEADRVLTEALADAHAAMRESVRRLDAIAAEIDRAAAYHAELAVDTSLGAREFQRFLLAKQREIAAVITQARELGQSKSAVLHSLRSQYETPAG